MKQPELLKKGDTVAIIAPAKAIEDSFINNSVSFWESQGFHVVVGKHCTGRFNYFSGTEAARASDLQAAINDEKVKAIICARGGYGCVQLLDYIHWAGLMNFPKWLIGFSDVTVFHLHLSHLGVQSLHATMPLNYLENTEESTSSMISCLTHGKMNYEWQPEFYKSGIAQGELVGGNLAVLSSLVGTSVVPNFKNKILFVEEVGEHIYAIDRMFYQLAKSGILNQLNGLIIGSFTNIKDTETPYGLKWQEVILHHFKYRNIPVAFDFPAGHQNDNRALIMGQEISYSVNPYNASFQSI